MSTNGRDVRIGDAEREAAVTALGEHYAAGRLDKDEYDERATEAWAAKTDAAIRPLFADLPQPHPYAAPRAEHRFGAASPGARNVPRPARMPVFPVVLVVLAIVLLVGSAWPLFLLFGGVWFFSRSRTRQRGTAGWSMCGPRSTHR